MKLKSIFIQKLLKFNFKLYSLKMKKRWTESKNWLRFKITQYQDIIDDVRVSDKEWFSSIKDYLKNEGNLFGKIFNNKLNKSNLIIKGLSEKTIQILIKNSTAQNWPNALKTKENREKNKEKIKEMYFCKFNKQFFHL
jgi:hypothetical protein